MKRGKSYTVGIDLGTTHIKACLADENAVIRAIASVDNGCGTDCAAGSCMDAQTLWEKTARVVRQVCGQADAPIIGAGVTGMADAGVPLNQNGEALYPVIPWSNPCGGEYREKILERFPLEDLFRRTGQRYHPKYAASRLLWLRDREPEVFREMALWLSVTDYLLFRLTGEAVTDESFACRTLLFDYRQREWDRELSEWFGAAGRLPRVVGMGEAVGTVTQRAELDTGLPAGIPVASAGHDHLCALRVLEASGGGAALNSLGTAEVFVGTADGTFAETECLRRGINRGCFAGRRTYWMANLPASGGSAEWLRGIVPDGGKMGYALFDDEGSVDSGGVTFFPYLSGSGTPCPNPNARGAFLGLSGTTTVRHLVRAVQEGIALETRRILDALEETFAIPLRKITATGGGTRSRPLMQAKADFSGREYAVCPEAELTALGAAWQAAGTAVPPPALGPGERFSPHGDPLPAYRRYLRQADLLRQMETLQDMEEDA